MDLKFRNIGPGTAELSGLKHLKKLQYIYNGRSVATTLVPSFLDQSFSFLQVTRITIKALAAFKHLKKIVSPGLDCNFYLDICMLLEWHYIYGVFIPNHCKLWCL